MRPKANKLERHEIGGLAHRRKIADPATPLIEYCRDGPRPEWRAEIRRARRANSSRHRPQHHSATVKP